MARPSAITKTLVTADDDGISASQTPGAAGNLTIAGALATGGVADLTSQRRVLVTTVSNESAKTLTIYGTDDNGNVISEVMTGPNATTGSTTADFRTVTRVAVSAAFTGAVIVGTNGVGASPWQPVDRNITPVSISIHAKLTGTTGYTIECTLDPLGDPATPPNPFDAPVAALVAASTSIAGVLSIPITAWRLKINSGTGSVRAASLQAGIT